jgi:lipopolysaccharide export system protein LptA
MQLAYFRFCFFLKNYFLPALFIFFLIIKFSSPAFGQEEIRIVHADELDHNESTGKQVQHLKGNVEFEHKGAILDCDVADFYPDTNRLVAHGHVHIRQDTINIYSKNLDYNGNTRKANLQDSVKLTDKNMQLTTDRLDYDMDSRVATYKTGGTLKNDTDILTSKIGYYYANTHDAYFHSDVKLVNKNFVLTSDTLRYNSDSKTSFFYGPTHIINDSGSIYCERGFYDTETQLGLFRQHTLILNPPNILIADSVLFDRKSGVNTAFHNVIWNDTMRKVSLYSDYAQYNQTTGKLLSTKHPMLVTLVDKDSMFMTSDTIRSVLDSEKKRIVYAYYNIKIYEKDLQGICDSLSYSYADSMFRLYKNPVIWSDNNQMKADTITLQMSNRQIKEMNLYQNSIVINRSDSLLYNQLQGLTMKGFFKDNQLHQLNVSGNAESVYYARQDSTKKYIGVNKAICSNIIVFLRDKKVKQIILLKKPDATLYPMKLANPEDLSLSDFEWLDAKRPQSKKDIEVHQ